MIKNLGLKKMMAVLVCTTMSAAAFAVPPGWGQRDPVCDQQVTDACGVFWQRLGYGSAQQCANVEKCMLCPPNYGYLCGVGAYTNEPDDAVKP